MNVTALPDHADRAPDVAMDRGSPARTGQMPGPGPAGTPSERWRFEVGEDIVSSAIVVGGVVFVAGTYEPLCAIDAASGQERWRFMGSGKVRGIPSTADLNGRTPAYADGLVFVCSEWARRAHALVYAVDANSGQERWRFATDGDGIKLPPIVDAGIVYVVDDDSQTRSGHLYALDAASGQERWRFRASGTIYPAPAVADGFVYVGSTIGNFHAVDAASGRERWLVRTRTQFGSGRLAHVDHAAVTEGAVFVSSSSNEALIALDAASGREQWRLPGLAWMPPTVADGVIYGVGSARDLTAVDAASGQLLWRVSSAGPANELVTIPVVANGLVYIGSRGGALSAVDAASGQERWRFPIGEKLTGSSSPAVVRGAVYVSGLHGLLFAFSGTDTPAPAE